MEEFEVRKCDARGTADLGWLYSRHTFSFGHYRDAKQVGFSDLLVINDDIVRGGGGFDTHPHRDMEIFTYVLEGALEHKDSMGTGSVIRPGDVQMMSAGIGITHSEFNHSKTDDVHFLQIWIVPNRKDVKPRYQQICFDEQEKRGKLRLIISPEGSENSLSVYQDARVYAGLLDDAEAMHFDLPKDRYGFLHVARGKLEVNGVALKAGDGVRLRKGGPLNFTNGQNAEILVFDLTAKELP